MFDGSLRQHADRKKTVEGNYLVSLRNLKALVYIDGNTGHPIWNLGGKRNNFTEIADPMQARTDESSGSALDFGWQHHARFWDDQNTIVCDRCYSLDEAS
jgi:hypothetical protein